MYIRKGLQTCLFKIISVMLTGIFLWNQIAWAGDLYSIDEVLDRQYDEQSSTFAPDYVQSQQSIHEDLISIQQDIENFDYTAAESSTADTQETEEDALDLQGPTGSSDEPVLYAAAASEGDGGAEPPQEGAILSITTQDGDVIHYQDGSIYSIDKADGTVIRNIALDSDGNLLDADIEYTDGTLQTILNGKVKRITKPDGTIFEYGDDERIETVTFADGSIATHSYETDELGNAITVVTDSEKISYYDSEDRLKKVVFNNGKIIEYEEGMLAKVIDDDKTYIYGKVEVVNGDETQYEVSLELIEAEGVRYHIENNNVSIIELSAGTCISDFVLDENGHILDAVMDYSDGTQVVVKGQRIVEITDTNSVNTSYEYILNESYEVAAVSVVIDNNGVIEKYAYMRDEVSGEITIVKDGLTNVESIIGLTDFINRSEGWTDTVEGSIAAYCSGNWIEYACDLGSSNMQTKLTVSARNLKEWWGSYNLPDSYTHFELEVYVDDVCYGSCYVPAAQVVYNEGTIDLGTLEGEHVIRLKWINDYWVPDTYDANIEINDIKTTSVKYPNDGDLIYEYDALWKLEKYTNDLGVFEHQYTVDNAYLGTVFTLDDGTIKLFDENKHLLETTFPDGTVYTYYDSGEFSGKLKKAVLPDGQIVLYSYKIADDGNLLMYKRTSYEHNNLYQSYYSTSAIDHALNPSFKATFQFDSDDTNIYLYARASYYKYNDKSISVAVNMYSQTPYLYYYRYDYVTKTTVRDNKYLSLVINKDTEYTVEYEWAETSVNVYLYETSLGRPATPIYTISDKEWNPSFSINGTNANIVLDPSTSGAYKTCKQIYTDYNRPLTGSPIHHTEFSFDSNATYKSMYYRVSGNTDTGYNSLYLNYYNGTASLNVYSYDYTTYDYEYDSIPINISFADDTDYVIETEVTDGALKIYIHEKGAGRGEAVYTIEDVSWDPTISASINGGDISVEAYDNSEIYEYDAYSGDLIEYIRTSDNEAIRYLYDQNGELTFKELLESDGTKKIYDNENRIVREEGYHGDITVYEYDDDGNLISMTPEFSQNTLLTYYDSGEFVGKVKKAVFPDGKVVFYSYNMTDTGNLLVYKRLSYDYSSSYQSYYSANAVDHTSNPSFKSTFTLDDGKRYNSLNARVYYYKYNEKSISLSVNVYGETPYIYYYKYDYVTKTSVRDNKSLNMTINKDVEYTVEYEWSEIGVNVYLYETSAGKPETPTYTISDKEWNPRFSVSGENANIALDPFSSGTYSGYQGSYTDYDKPLIGSPIHSTEFSFDSSATYKSMYYSIYGYTDTGYNSLYLNYYNGTTSLNIYSYDYTTYDYDYDSIPIEISFNDDTDYIIESEVVEGTLKVYIYEKGSESGEAVYTMENVTWDPNISSSINGGELNTEIYYNAEIYESNTQRGVLLEDDVIGSMQNKNIIIDDPSKVLPDDVFGCGAPLVFPDGNTDIVNDRTFNLDLSITLPGDMFGNDGKVIDGYDFTDNLYFDTFVYDQEGIICEIQKVTGEILKYADGLPADVISGADSTLYTFEATDVGSIQNIIVERANVRSVYDPITGELLSIEKDGTEVLFDENSIMFKMLDGSYLSASSFDSEAGDGIFEKKDSNGNIIEIKEYSGGKLIFYKDEYGNEYKYDDDENLIELKKYIASGAYVTYVYTPSVITTGVVPDDQIANLNDNDPILIKYENTDSGQRIIYLETKDGHYKEYSYTETGIEVIEGSIEFLDSQQIFERERLKKYNTDLLLISVEEENGVLVLYEYNPDITVLRVTVIKDNIAYIVESNILRKIISQDGLEAIYYDNGLIKSVEVEPRILKEYKYGTKSNLLFNTANVFTNGILDHVTYNEVDENIVELSLGIEEKDYGDGSDGDLIVESGETFVINSSKQYSSIYIAEGARVTVAAWDGTTGGEIDVRCNGSVVIDGIFEADAKGYRGGSGYIDSSSGIPKVDTMQGESYAGNQTYSHDNNYGGGGGAYLEGYLNPLYPYYPPPFFVFATGGGGGSYGTKGGNGQGNAQIVTDSGDIYGDQCLTDFHMGSGGGAGAGGVAGGNGGGKVKLVAQEINISGTVSSNGGNGSCASGGGSGGAIWLVGENVHITGTVVAQGGQGNYESGLQGGNGGDGRIRIDYANLNVSGTIGSAAYYEQYNYAEEGAFESEVIEINTEIFGNISWLENLPNGTDIVFQTRTGNTLDFDSADSDWSNWSESLTDFSGSQISSYGAKYIQYRAILTTQDNTITPKLILNDTQSINIEYAEMQDGEVNIEDISFVKISEGATACYYNSDGLNVHDPNNSVDMSDLTIEQDLVNEIFAVFFDENIHLDMNPGMGLAFEESSKEIWTGTVDVADYGNLGDNDAITLAYEMIPDDEGTGKRISVFKKKNGDMTYYNYDTGSTVIEEIKGEDGKTFSYKISSYDTNDILQQVKLFYEDETKNQIINYENGRIKNVTQNGNDLLTYTYETFEGGREVTVINDMSYGADSAMKKYYIDGQLVKTIDKNGIETGYTYDKDGRILRSIVSRSGKEMEKYDYSYDDDSGYTTIEDLTGVRKIYNDSNKLLYVEKDNKIFAYYYAQGQTLVQNDNVEDIKAYMDTLKSLADTNELLRDTDLSTEFGDIEDAYTYMPSNNFAIEELLQYTDEEGNVIVFNNGEIVSITRHDGIVIKDIGYENGVIKEYRIVHPVEIGGITYAIKENHVYCEENLDGSKTYYYSNGWVRSTIDQNGNETEYIYEVPLVLTGQNEGSTYYTNLNGSVLTLSEDAVEGNFVSVPIEVNAKELRNIDWSAVVPEGASVALRIRTTDSLNETDIEASNWSAWSDEIVVSGSLASVPSGKYLQYEVILRRSTQGETPSVDLTDVSIEILSCLSENNDANFMHAIEYNGKTYIYDGQERLIKIIDGAITYTYTVDGKIASIVENAGNTRTYLYDEKDTITLTEIIEDDGANKVHYDSDGRLTKVIESDTGTEYHYYYHGDTVTVKTIKTSKQALPEDFEQFNKEGIAIDDYEGVTHIRLERQVPLDYGTGEDGALIVKKGETRVLAAGTYNFESIYIEEGATLTVEAWNGVTGGQLVIKCQKEAVIDGTISVDAKGYIPEQGSGAGGRGLNGYDVDNQNTVARGAGGGGAGHATNGETGEAWNGEHYIAPGVGGSAYSDQEITMPMMGSGGGYGGIYSATDKVDCGAGGSGGGIIQITSPILNVNGLISANGENGGNTGGGSAGSGGGGAGGAIILDGEQVTLVGNITARGGYGGTVGQDGGDGAPGRIRVNYGISEGNIFAESQDAPAIHKASVYRNQLTYISQGNLTSDAIALGSTSADIDSTGYINANLDIPILANVKVATRTGASDDTSAWSDEWTEATLDQFGYKINSDINEYIQYRFVLTTEENDKSPSIYALDDFAIKMTFTEETLFSAYEVVYEAPALLPQINLPELVNNPADRIENVTTGDGVAVQDILSVTDVNLFYTADNLAEFTNDIYSNMLDENEPIATKFSIDENGNMKTEYVQKKDGSIEHYDEDGKIRFITDGNGTLLMRNYYDADGNLKDVRLWAERDRLSHEIKNAEIAILRKKIEDLQRLADEVNAAHESLDTQVKEIQEEFDATREELESTRYISYETQVSSTFGAKTTMITVENPYYSMMIAKLDLAERQFHDNAALSYFSLANMENVSKGRIEAATMAAFSNLKRQRDVCMVQILRKELTTVIYDYYLKFLGRLPDTQELNDLIEGLAQKSEIMQDTYTLNVGNLKTDLENSDERGIRVEQIQRIIDGITLALNDYFVSDTNKEGLINTLGLQDESVVELATDDKDAILNWFTNSQQSTMHFGQSAFLVLKELVDDYYEAHPELANAAESDLDRYVRLAVNAILIDVLTGVINPFTDGDLQLSLFALSKAANIEGLALNTYKLEWEDLVERVANYKNGAKEKMIVHMKSNHYVLVTEIDAEGNVTYYEPNMGDSGESITVTKEEFLDIWEGYTLSNKAPPEAAKQLTALQAQKIRGAGIFLIISIVCSIISFGLSFIDNEICQILSKVFAIAAVVCGALEILGNLKAIYDGFINGIQAFKDMFVMAFTKIGDFFTGNLATFANATLKVSTILPTAGQVGQAIFNTVISIPTTITMTRGLEFMGLDERFARIVGSFLSMGTTMGIGNGFDFSVGGAMQGFAVSGLRELGDVFDIPSEITSIISISVGAIINAGISGYNNNIIDPITQEVLIKKGPEAAMFVIGQALNTTILPNIASELAYYGIQEVGELLGIDPRISYLAGIGIRSSLQMGFGNGGLSAQELFQGAMTGLTQGVASIGLNYLTDELDINPLLANMGFSVIAQFLQAAIVPSNVPNDDRNVFEKMFNTFVGNVATFLGYNSTPNRDSSIFWEINPITGEKIPGTFNQNKYDMAWGQYYWQEAAYTAQILDFSTIVERDGIETALNTYATGFFNSTAINAILATGKTIGKYFLDELNLVPEITEKVVEVKEDGEVVQRITFKKTNGVWDVAKVEDLVNNTTLEGRTVVDAYGNWAFYDDTIITENYGTYVLIQHIDEGFQRYAEVRDMSGNILLIIEPDESGACNYYNSAGEYQNVIIRRSNGYGSKVNSVKLSGDSVSFVEETDVEGIMVETVLSVDSDGIAKTHVQNLIGDMTKLNYLMEIITGIDMDDGRVLTFGERVAKGFNSFNHYSYGFSSQVALDLAAMSTAEVFEKIGITRESVLNSVETFRANALDHMTNINNYLIEKKSEGGAWKYLDCIVSLDLKAAVGGAASFEIKGVTLNDLTKLEGEALLGASLQLWSDGLFSDKIKVGTELGLTVGDLEASGHIYTERRILLDDAWSDVEIDFEVSRRNCSITKDGQFLYNFKVHSGLFGMGGSIDIGLLSEYIYEDATLYFNKLSEAYWENIYDDDYDPWAFSVL